MLLVDILCSEIIDNFVFLFPCSPMRPAYIVFDKQFQRINVTLICMQQTKNTTVCLIHFIFKNTNNTFITWYMYTYININIILSHMKH